MTDRDGAARLAELLRESGFTLVFTGAGISTGSGIADFRGPQGVWKRFKPVYFDEFLASGEARVRHWEYKLSGWESFRDARPNAAHLALVELEKRGKLQLVVTQNIDGLHQLAGHAEERVLELHGTNRWIECVECRQRLEPGPVFEEFARTRRPPQCGKCEGWLKPATVSFGQSLPADVLRAAFEGAARAELVISIGSTLEVEPAASIPRTAKESGAAYVIVNQGPTAHDRITDFKIEGDAVRVLPACVGLL